MSETDNREPGSYDWTVSRLSLPGDPTFTAIAKVACTEWTVWPEQLVGRLRAGEAVSNPDNPPLSFTPSDEPSRVGHAVLARRVSWHLASRLTEASATEIGDVFGGHSAATVRPYIVSPEVFDMGNTPRRFPRSGSWDGMIAMVEFVLELEHL